MSEIADTGHRTAAVNVVHESYAFACMRCGHGWEQSYEIEHHVDAKGQEFVTYVANGQRVPSPLTRPTCLNCGGHVVRIMRAGQVSSVRSALESLHHRQAAHRVAKGGTAAATDEGATPGDDDPAAEPKHHWHLSDLLHPFHHRKAG
ncbi:hypothetical protein [Streptomyces flavofungini]|uniref:C2H2-type domain-containing protein n=1 Tax=Streptomyces flavofungini TaxID=68200 RepID=A0ABS0X097_9ACTN|nr:hypothetical protein [Streptomyces flavofungini]MBJ3806589.1 hypothetical protein [Streptomyces flavofungini]GHC61857.1 hypothetical protein GCM10010349_32010 [Streptomyces flavofungini]